MVVYLAWHECGYSDDYYKELLGVYATKEKADRELLIQYNETIARYPGYTGPRAEIPSYETSEWFVEENEVEE